MMQVNQLLDTYVRPDDGTSVLLCFHTSSAQCAAWVYTGCTLRGAEPTAIPFSVDDDVVGAQVVDAISTMKREPSTRRIAVIVCEPHGPSLVQWLELKQKEYSTKKRIEFFRITPPAPTIAPIKRH